MSRLQRGFSDFWLESTKRYRYLPWEQLSFTQGKLCLYRYEGRAIRAMYLGKVYFTALSLWALISEQYLLNTAVLACGFMHLLLKCRLAKEVRLLDSGKEIEIDYHSLPFVRNTEVVPIKTLRNTQKSVLMGMWMLNPLTNNVTAALDSSLDELLPWYVPTHSHFYLFPKHPKVHKIELLVSVLQGVEVETHTKKPKSHDVAQHYVVINDPGR